MVELLEYVIIFGISAGIAGASVMLLNGASPILARLAASSVAEQVGGAARLAATEGQSVSIVVPLDGTSVGCAAGTLSVSGGGLSGEYEVGLPCSFLAPDLSGDCSLTFSAPGNALELEASC